MGIRSIPDTIVKLVFLLLHFLISPLAALPHPTTLQPRQNASSSPLRDVYLIADVAMEAKAVSSKTGKPIFGLHTSLQIDGTTFDGPLRVEVGFNTYAKLQLRATDLGVAQSGQPIGFWGVSNSRRYVRQTGQISLTNADIIDHQTGTGLLAKVWNQNPLYRRGGGLTPNTGIDLVQRLLGALNLPVESSMALIYSNGEEYYTDSSDIYSQTINDVWSIQQPNGNSTTDDWVRVFDVVTNPAAPALLLDSRNTSLGSDDLSERHKRQENPLAYDQTAWFTDAVTQAEMESLPPPASRALPTIQEESKSAVSPFEATLGQRGAAGLVETAEVTIGRTAGVLLATYMIGEGIAETLGGAVGPLFVLLDMVNGQWLSAAMVGIGVVLGTIAAAAAAGPVGWIYGLAIGTLFAILPNIWNKPHTASISDKQAIVQYKFFGDSTHTGNEQCQSLGNQNCTAVYGPGVLSLVFGWENFDSIAFLIQYNKGYPITLPELANSFYNIDDPANHGKGDGSDQIATLKCNNVKGTANAFGGWEGSDPGICSKPSFALNRALITLPVLNETADKIYPRIIPNPGGDCKLINNAATDMNIPEYNLTIRGEPVAIACNVSASEVVDGNIVPIGPTNNQTPTNVSSANSSTDGLAGHQLSVPAPTPFAALLNSTSALCLNGQGGVLCLPNGTYDVQKGSLGFTLSEIDTLTMPAGSSMRWWEIGQSMPHFGPSKTLVAFAQNQTADNKWFAKTMSGLSFQWNASVPNVPTPPVICLFTSSNHMGDVRCYGPGGGPLESDIVNRTQSIAVHGNATATIYAQEYGDAGGATVTADVKDLTDQVYGESNFNQRMVALRVCDGSCAAGQA